MKIKRQEAIKLRLKGYSYSEIHELLNIPKSTLSTWLKDIVLSEGAQKRILKKYTEGYTKGLLKKSVQQTHNAKAMHARERANATKSISELSLRDLRMLGIGLYWGEGYKKLKSVLGVTKTVHPLSLSNSDAKLIKAYILFLTKVCKVPSKKIRAGVRIYEHQNAEHIIKYWSRITGLPSSQFTKPYIGVSKSSLRKKPYNSLPYGTIRIDVYDTSLFYTVMGWIDGVQKQL